MASTTITLTLSDNTTLTRVWQDATFEGRRGDLLIFCKAQTGSRKGVTSGNCTYTTAPIPAGRRTQAQTLINAVP